jgi:son of sevenless-like protein
MELGPHLKQFGCLDKSDICSITGVDPSEIAKQLTLIDAEMFCKIDSKEWINQIWGRVHEKNAAKAPNIDKMVLQTNKITRMVAKIVLSYEREKDRLNTIKHFIQVAQECAALNNFNALTSITAGLSIGPVKRLDRTWMVGSIF